MSTSTTNGNIINNFAELLKQSGKTLINYKCANLIAPGENYGSLMLAVEVRAKNKNGDQETIQLVAKLLPQNEWIQKMFNIPVTFKKEVYFYRDLLPTFCAFQLERGMTETMMKFFPKYYGSRLSLNSESNTVDSDAALLLENLKFAGCETIERTVGFNSAEIRLILADLAVFHAVPIAFKKCHPEAFQEKCMPHLEKPVVFTDMSEDVYKQSFAQLVKNLERTKEVLPFIERMKKVYQLCSDNMMNHINPFREPYATIIHNDYWVNNTMIKMSEDKTPLANIMVDFQLIEYGNPACDLIFLLFTSVQQEVLKMEYNELVSLYHEKFVETLEKLKCDASAFSEMALREELRLAARETQFCHCLVMCRPIHADRAFIKELNDMTEKDMLTEDGLTAGYFRKIAEVVLNFVERDWI